MSAVVKSIVKAGPAQAEAAEPTPAFSPLYQQIKALLMRSLQQGEWKPGEAIPSEIDLAARYKVSQGTVRKAIDELAAENLLLRRQGKGTFVATHHEEQVRYRFLRLLPDRPGGNDDMTREVLECRRLRCPADIARALALAAGAGVLFIKRRLRFSGKAVVLDELWLPGDNFKGLNAERLAAHRGPLYAFFEAEFGTRMVRAEEKLRAVAADAEQARLLEVASGFPLLRVDRLSFSYGDRPVEVRRGHYVTDAHYYRNELQ